MVTEAAVKKMASVTLSGNFDEDFENDIEALLREHQQQHHNHHWSQASFNRERDLNIYRSGSAPPTVEGSRNAIGSLLGGAEVRRFGGQNAGNVLLEEEMRSHLAYASYYYSNENLNPRLPPPFLSKEEWRAAQRFGSGGSAFVGIGDRRGRKQVEGGGSSSSLFSLQPSLSVGSEKESVEHVGGGEWLEKGQDGLMGLPEIGLEARRKSFADVLQEDFNHSCTSVGEISSLPAIQNAFDNSADPVAISDVHLSQLHNAAETHDTIRSFRSGRTSPGLVRVQSLSSTMTQPFASAVDPSLTRSRTPDPQLIGRLSSPCLSSVESRVFDTHSKMVRNGFGGFPSQTANYVDVAAALAGLNMASNEVSKNTTFVKDDISALTSNEQINLQKCLSSSNLSKTIAALRSSNFAGSTGHYKTDSLHADSFESNPNTYLLNGFPSILNNQLDAGIPAASSTSKYANRHGSQVGYDFQVPHMDLLHAQYQRASGSTSSFSRNLNEISLGGSYLGTSDMDFTEYQRAYLEALLAQKKQQNGGSLSKGSGLSNGSYGTSGLRLGVPYPSSPISSVLSSLGPGSHLRQNDRVSSLPSMLRSMGVSKRSWNHENGIMEEGFGSTLLEEFKNSKTRSFELSDIVDHVVEFSADQYGSRFIQQKLETATVEGKNKIFPEILPHARALMTDVFGNYVIQKFFEHGTESQGIQLAGQVIGHVLPLSLQMYGCRVIQKALEVVDVEQQIQMISELDGSVMKCVRDQNGNHVIQKCIECVPQEKIQFIISSFYGQVVALSTHPYGCRVIQRVLEHCNDAKTQSIMMDEILQSVCTLALDQYGNYVVQHVLQHGKPEERSAMISKLSGQIVTMSQQKFASNVIEKCLTYGSPRERLLLIKEMLGSTEENEPLQAMMKDQFANYVVQKVLETCDDQNRELILSRIKVHLNALKRYTYGKHIVARVEKLIAAGERRMRMATSS